jgi:hypothetical protein
MRLGAALALLLATTAHAEEGRGRGGVWAGPAVVNGRLDYTAPTARISTRLDALPAVAAGLDLWPEESLGLYLALAIGTGADLKLPTGGKLRYTVHQLEAGTRYRWFLGPGRDAFALVASLGMRGVQQDVQAQRPSLLVSSTVAGPELAASLEAPLGPVWLRLTARGGLPFFVRETPADSGDPLTYAGYGARAELVADLFGEWSARLAADVQVQRIEYRGVGTRAAGVNGGRTEDRFATLMLVARHRL